MNILYLLGALIMLLVPGYAYFIFTKATKEKGALKITGFTLSGLLVVLLLLLIILCKTGRSTSFSLPAKGLVTATN